MKRENAILLVERSSITYLSQTLKQAIAYSFAADTLRDLEIINKDKFVHALDSFIVTNKLTAASVIVILADAIIFTKDIVSTPPAPPLAKPGEPPQPAPPATKLTVGEINTQTDQFLETVPFENIITKMYPIPQGMKVVAANGDLYETIAEILQSKGWSCDVVIPAFLVTQELSHGVTPDALNAIGGKMEMHKTHSLTVYQESIPAPTSEEQPSSETTTPENTKPDKKRVYALVGAFGVLVLVFVVMLINMMNENAKPQKTAGNPTIIPRTTIPSATLAPSSSAGTSQPGSVTPSPADASASASIMPVTIQIMSSADTAARAKQIKTVVTSLASSATLVSQNGSTGPKTTIIFLATVPKATQNAIIQKIAGITREYTVQQTTEQAADVIIISGNL